MHRPDRHLVKVEIRIQVRGQSVERGQSAGGDAVDGCAKTNDVCAQNPAGIVLHLLVALERLLWRQIVWPRIETGVVENKLGKGEWIDRKRLRISVPDDLVVKLEVSHANALRPVAVSDVNANSMSLRIVSVGVIGEARVRRGWRIIPVVGELIKNARVRRSLQVEPAAGL